MACIAGWLINDHTLSLYHFWTLWEQVKKVKSKSPIWHSFGEWPKCNYWWRENNALFWTVVDMLSCNLFTL